MIQELMIINYAGIAVFHHNFIDSKKIDDQQSLASYFDIICKFTKQSFKESLRMITLDSLIFFFFTHQSNYYLVFKCDNKEFDKKMLEDIAKRIADDFVVRYGERLRNFNGEISYFKPFSEIVENYLSTGI
ncbi:MAG: hypothetical protein ACW986_06000 [Promethearchaeota archaeon]|jgi:hypothetical protein